MNKVTHLIFGLLTSVAIAQTPLSIRTDMQRLSDRLLDVHVLDNSNFAKVDQSYIDQLYIRAKSHFQNSRCHQALVDLEAMLSLWQVPKVEIFLESHFMIAYCASKNFDDLKSIASAKAFLLMSRHDGDLDRSVQILEMILDIRARSHERISLDDLFLALNQRAFHKDLYLVLVKHATLHKDFELVQMMLKMLDPKDSAFLLMKSTHLIQSGDIASARRILMNLLSTDLKQFALLAIARSYVSQREYANAVDYYQKLDTEVKSSQIEEYLWALLGHGSWNQVWEIGVAAMNSQSVDGLKVRKQILPALVYALLKDDKNVNPQRRELLKNRIAKDLDKMKAFEEELDIQKMELSNLPDFEKDWSGIFKPVTMLSQFSQALWKLQNLDHKAFLSSTAVSQTYHAYGLNEHWFFKASQFYKLYQSWVKILDDLLNLIAAKDMRLKHTLERGRLRRSRVLNDTMRPARYSSSRRISVSILNDQLLVLGQRILDAKARLSPTYLLSDNPDIDSIIRLNKLQKSHVDLVNQLKTASTIHSAHDSILGSDYNRVKEIASLYEIDFAEVAKYLQDSEVAALIDQSRNLTQSMLMAVKKYLNVQEEGLRTVFAKVDELDLRLKDMKRRQVSIHARLLRSFEIQKDRLENLLKDEANTERMRYEKWISDLDWYGSRVSQGDLENHKIKHLDVLNKLRADLIDLEYGVGL